MLNRTHPSGGCHDRAARTRRRRSGSPSISPTCSSPATSSRCRAISAPARPRWCARMIRHLAGDADDRGAEPDLHADADLRPAAIRRSCMPTSIGCPGRTNSPSSASRTCRRRRRADGMAGPRRRLAAVRPPRHRAHARRRNSSREHRIARIAGYGASRRASRGSPRSTDSSTTTGYGEAERERIAGDASSRSYERLHRGERQRRS